MPFSRHRINREVEPGKDYVLLSPAEWQQVIAATSGAQATLNRADRAIERALTVEDTRADLQEAVDCLCRGRQRLGGRAVRDDDGSLVAALLLTQQAIDAAVAAADRLAPAAAR